MPQGGETAAGDGSRQCEESQQYRCDIPHVRRIPRGISDVVWCLGTPPSVEIHKTALGAEDSVPWMHFDSTLEAVAHLRGLGYRICVLEQVEGSVPLQEFSVEPGQAYAIIAGHEVKGVDQEVVDAADCCIEIPQFGSKHSLNVSVSAGITLWHLFSHMQF